MNYPYALMVFIIVCMPFSSGAPLQIDLSGFSGTPIAAVVPSQYSTYVTSQGTALSPKASSVSLSSQSYYSKGFDLRNLKGFNDDAIKSEDIVAFIRDKSPFSPMLDEEGIGDCFVDAGLDNNVNPAFLVATAYLEGGFGYIGWAKMHPECHNSFGYAIDPDNESANRDNCMDSWCSMVRRVASVISKGNSYYNQNLYSVEQVYAKYSKNGDSKAVADLMNELYSFSLNRKTDNKIFQSNEDMPSTVNTSNQNNEFSEGSKSIYHQGSYLSPEGGAWLNGI